MTAERKAIARLVREHDDLGPLHTGWAICKCDVAATIRNLEGIPARAVPGSDNLAERMFDLLERERVLHDNTHTPIATAGGDRTPRRWATIAAWERSGWEAAVRLARSELTPAELRVAFQAQAERYEARLEQVRAERDARPNLSWALEGTITGAMTRQRLQRVLRQWERSRSKPTAKRKATNRRGRR